MFLSRDGGSRDLVISRGQLLKGEDYWMMIERRVLDRKKRKGCLY